MRQAAEQEMICPITIQTVRAIFGRPDLDVSEENMLMRTGMEALLTHPKNDEFFVRVSFDRVNFDSDRRRISDVVIFSEYKDVGGFCIHRPDGSERKKPQLQIRFDYDVQTRRPFNVRRTLDRNAIHKYVHALRPTAQSSLAEYLKSNASTFIDKSSEFTKSESEIDNLVRKLYYMNAETQTRVMRSLLCGGDGIETVEGKSIKRCFEEAFAKIDEAKAARAELMKHSVLVVESPGEKFTVVRHIVTNGSKDYLFDKVIGKSNLPADILGSMAVLDIVPTTSRDMSVPGVGMIQGTMCNAYVLIGDNFVDPRSESQSPSN
jgi:hypothetical protein